MSVDERWPELPLAAWKDTQATLHMYLQVVGKIRLELAPPEPEWGHVALAVTARGLTTGPIPYRGLTFEIQFDFIAHELSIATNDGRVARFELTAKPVKQFYADVMKALRGLSIDVRINPLPQEIPNPIPFPDDSTHSSYDPHWANRYWRLTSSIDAVFKKFRAHYRGRHTPVNFWWGSCDLGYSRYSGRPADPPPNAGLIMRLSMDAEESAAGFWPGDDRFPEPAFYAYAYPKPAGIETAAIRPAGATWSATLGEFLLPYEAVRTSPDPEAALLAFLESTFAVVTSVGGWPNR